MSSVKIETVIRLYCDGPPHNHRAIVLRGLADSDAVRAAIIEAGYLVLADGRAYCPKHQVGVLT